MTKKLDFRWTAFIVLLSELLDRMGGPRLRSWARIGFFWLLGGWMGPGFVRAPVSAGGPRAQDRAPLASLRSQDYSHH